MNEADVENLAVWFVQLLQDATSYDRKAAAEDIGNFANSVKDSFLDLIGMDEDTLKKYINEFVESSRWDI